MFGLITRNIRTWQRLLAGGLAGVACWVSGYPLDSLKSNVQALHAKGKIPLIPDGTILREALKIHTAHGYKGFMNGVFAIMGRAFFANAVGFWLWEVSKQNITVY